MIYLEPEIQQRIVSLFLFALQPEGCLFLGPAESVGQNEDRFRALSKKWRIFQRAGGARRGRVELPATTRTSLRLEPRPSPPKFPHSRHARLAGLGQQILLERFAPAAVLVNGRNETLYFSGPTERYLRHPRGAPTNDLLMLVREGLSARLREALTAVAARDTTVELRDLRVKRGDAFQPVRITVLPVAAPDLESAPLRLVVFQDDPRPAGAQPRRPQAPESEIIRQLEDDLIVARGD